MIKFYLFLFSSMLFGANAMSQTCNLFFSEYLEGASNNKAIEIYNPLNVTVNLTDYVIYRYNNGSATPTDSLFPQGTLASEEVFVAGNPSAIPSITVLSDTLHTITFFNGDDAMELRYRPTNTQLDIIGIIGVDPGVNWVVGSGATSEFTLVRMISHTDGELNWGISSTEWNVYPQNTSTFIGSHSGAPCCLPNSSNLSVNACSNYTWAENGQTYTISGSYNDTLTNVAGCDSIITLNLTIGLPTTSSLTISACSNYMWLENNITYSNSGSYNDTLVNSVGCDSIITLNLTINSPTTSNLTISACSNYTWLENNITYSNSGSYNDTLVNAAGCDSIITLHLTINTPSTSNSTISACSNYTWAQNGQTYTASGSYNDTLTNVGGCDSIITLNLTIQSNPTITIVNTDILTATNSNSYQWINCVTNSAIINETSQTFSPATNGTYACIGTTASGCSDTSNCLVINYIGIDEQAANQINLFPNPTTSNVTLQFASTSAAQLTLFDAQGKFIRQQEVFSGENISLENLERGVYFLNLIMDGKEIVKRVVKQ